MGRVNGVLTLQGAAAFLFIWMALGCESRTESPPSGPAQDKTELPPSSARVPQETVIFAVSSQIDPGESDPRKSIEPIALIVGSDFKPTPGEGQALNRFGETYYRPGLSYRLLWGGAEAGKVVVKHWENPESGGCFYNGTEVEIQMPASLGETFSALATNSNRVGRQRASRRTPSLTEKDETLKVAREAFQRNGVPSILLSEVKMLNLTASDVTGDGVAEILGSFKIEETRKSLDDVVTHALFLILEKKGKGFQSGMVWYHSGAEMSYEVRNLVDQLDLDDDGIDEVITEGSYYEWNSYQIYKKHEGGWKVIYEGGGGGC